ncbi:uncharacterized protein IAS62_003966 [Cryptococcus decagattii]|uniref:Thioesterase n=1 Tax=Cryptococcus decagattii TaxID=1859122 RepID=A0ABZ2AZJ9_9TREE
MTTTCATASKIPVPTSLVSGLRSLIGSFTSSSTPLLPFIPKPLKLILLLLFLAHSPSWPFVWHVRVWWHGVKAYYLAWHKGRARYLVDWKAQNDKNGGIRSLRVRHKRIAGVDDCDYNMHLSNSSYAKNSDALKMDWCIKALSPSFTARGTYMALGATHYVFFKEIPIGSEYTMEAYCLGWDEKWMFLACEFVIYPKKTSKAGGTKNKVATSVVSSAPHIVPTISAPPTRTASPNSSTPVSGTATPAQGSPLGNKVEEIKRAWLARRKENPRKDGGVTCCLSISEYCFKIDRVTIPPRISLYISLQSPSKEHQDRARAILMSKDGGRAFLLGGWREESNSELLGTDIGLAEGEEFQDSWLKRGAESMEKVVDGLSAF